MEVASIAIAALAAFFGGVAAWKAKQTVELTQRMRIEDQREHLRAHVRRLAEALLNVELIGNEMPLNTFPDSSPERYDPFTDTIRELKRASQLMEIDGWSEKVVIPIRKLTRNEDVWKKPRDAAKTAAEARSHLQREAAAKLRAVKA